MHQSRGALLSSRSTRASSSSLLTHFFFRLRFVAAIAIQGHTKIHRSGPLLNSAFRSIDRHNVCILVQACPFRRLLFVKSSC